MSTARLLAAQHRSRLTGLGREEPRVRGQVQLGPIVGTLDDQSREARVQLDMMDGETRVAERSIHDRHKPVDVIGRQAEEVEVARLSQNISARDQRSAARKREPLRLLEAGDDLRYRS